MPTIHATTACFPGATVRSALDRIQCGLSEPVIGPLSAAHIQLCPQNFGCLNEAEVESLRASYPDSAMRLHANARVLERHLLWDAASVSDHTLPFFNALADRSRRLGAAAMTIHAGVRAEATIDQMFDNVRRLQGEVFGDIRIGVEGLYPHAKRPQLLSTWADHDRLLRAEDIDFAVDLSHLNIIATHEGVHDDLVRELVASPRCIEVHVSGNDGERDQHEMLTEEPWWIGLLDHLGPNAIVFSESNHARTKRTIRTTRTITYTTQGNNP